MYMSFVYFVMCVYNYTLACLLCQTVHMNNVLAYCTYINFNGHIVAI